MIGFERSRNFDGNYDTSLMGRMGLLDKDDVDRLRRIRQAWNFYEGYHWEDIPPVDTPELTINYCRAFVDKFTAFELGKSFAIQTHPDLDKTVVTDDGLTLFQFLEDVWDDNDQFLFCNDMGQMKSVTGDAWVQVRYFSPEELDDPFDEYPKGRIGILLHNTGTIFPKYDPHRKGVVISVEIMYEYTAYTTSLLSGNPKETKRLFKQVWTKEETSTDYGDGNEAEVVENPYGFIPFVQIKNLNLAGRNEGRGDLDDVIPLNTELDMKASNVSEIIDYHSAPITVVYGAKIGNLEKGANKVWGGLPKDAKVENLTMNTELGASTTYINFLKIAMCEVAGIPESVLGGAQSISNTSGVAMQYMNLPLIEKTRIKRMNTENALENLNKYIIHIALEEGLISMPEMTTPVGEEDEAKPLTKRDFYWVEVTLPDTLPKDMLIELQQIQSEMGLGMESRKGGMRRLGKENVDKLISEIDADRKDNPSFYGMTPESEQTPQLNSGMTNGQTAVEQVRLETTGQNGGSTETE